MSQTSLKYKTSAKSWYQLRNNTVSKSFDFSLYKHKGSTIPNDYFKKYFKETGPITIYFEGKVFKPKGISKINYSMSNRDTWQISFTGGFHAYLVKKYPLLENTLQGVDRAYPQLTFKKKGPREYISELVLKHSLDFRERSHDKKVIENFKQWFKNTTFRKSGEPRKDSTLKKYISVLNGEISKYLIKYNFIQLTIFEIYNLDYLKKLKKIYFEDKKNKEKDKKHKGYYSAPFSVLIKYHESDISSEHIKAQYPPTSDKDKLDKNVKELLNKGISGKPKGNKKPKKKKQTSMVIERDPKVVAWTLWHADGICEGCNKNAPFLKIKDNNPYLEVHHVDPLKESLNDSIENTVALCPNCHRKAHSSKERLEFRKSLAKVAAKHSN